MNATINADERPRLLIYGSWAEQIVEQLRELAGTLRQIQSIDEVDPTEWDLLIAPDSLTQVPGANGNLPSDIYAIAFVENLAYDIPGAVVDVFNSKGARHYVSAEGPHKGRELSRVERIPPALADVIKQSLVQALKDRLPHQTFHCSLHNSVGGRAEEEFRPFLLHTATGKPLAGAHDRGSAEGWILPKETADDVVEWVRVAIELWHLRDPIRFPAPPNWLHSKSWFTRDERAAQAAIDECQTRRAAILAELDAELEGLQTAMGAIRQTADDHDRLLLSGTGESLVDEVAQCLRELGFTVRIGDNERGTGQRQKEDLTVTDPDAADWLCLAEVKGFTRGAATSAFQQVLEHRRLYERRNQVDVTAVWNVVNHYREREPLSRPEVFRGQADDVGAFREAGGLVIDTPWLYRIREVVRDGGLNAADVREHLRNSVGIVSAIT